MRKSPSAAPARWFRQAGAIAGGLACLLLAECASGPVSADLMFGGVSASAGAMPSPGPAGSRDGIYVGSAEVAVNGTFSCLSPMAITAFRVDGNVVHFGAFQGPIADDGSVLLPFRGNWLSGRFDGPTFVGRIDATDDWGQFVGCIYAVSVTRRTG